LKRAERERGRTNKGEGTDKCDHLHSFSSNRSTEKKQKNRLNNHREMRIVERTLGGGMGKTARRLSLI